MSKQNTAPPTSPVVVVSCSSMFQLIFQKKKLGVPSRLNTTHTHTRTHTCYVTTQSLGASSHRQQPADSACQALLKLALHVLAAAAFLLITQFLLCRVCGVGLCLLQRSNADSYGVQSRGVLSERSVAKPVMCRKQKTKQINWTGWVNFYFWIRMRKILFLYPTLNIFSTLDVIFYLFH